MCVKVAPSNCILHNKANSLITASIQNSDTNGKVVKCAKLCADHSLEPYKSV